MSRTASTASFPVPSVRASAIVGLSRTPCFFALARPRSVASATCSMYRLAISKGGTWRLGSERPAFAPLLALAVVDGEAVEETSHDVIGVGEVEVSARQGGDLGPGRSCRAAGLAECRDGEGGGVRASPGQGHAKAGRSRPRSRGTGGGWRRRSSWGSSDSGWRVRLEVHYDTVGSKR